MNIGGIGGSPLTALKARPFIPLDKGQVETFAQEMTRRAEQTALPEKAERTVDAEGLGKAVTNAVEYVEEHFGDKAARVVMGIVLKRAGDGPVTEDSLGQGFVDALEFVDRNFGIANGDKAMAFFNGELNSALNGYFQNGEDEDFLVLDQESAAQDLGQATSQVISKVMKKFTENAKAPSILDSALADMEESLDEAGQEDGQTIAEEMAVRAVDENGFPVDDGQDASLDTGQAAGGASVEAGQAQASAEQAQTRQGSASRSRRRSIQRRPIASSNPYQQSGLSAGSVVSVSV